MTTGLHLLTTALLALGAVTLLSMVGLGVVLVRDAVGRRRHQFAAVLAWEVHVAAAQVVAAANDGIEACDFELWSLEVESMEDQ